MPTFVELKSTPSLIQWHCTAHLAPTGEHFARTLQDQDEPKNLELKLSMLRDLEAQSLLGGFSGGLWRGTGG